MWLQSTYFDQYNEIFKELFPETPDIYDMVRNSSLVLQNIDPAMSYNRPTMPHVIPIGGLLNKIKPKPLPADLQKFADDSSKSGGFIYVSMGSHAKSTSLPQSTNKAFVKALGKTKYKVLWKHEADSLPEDFPKNIRTMEWVPQLDILGLEVEHYSNQQHKNIELIEAQESDF